MRTRKLTTLVLLGALAALPVAPAHAAADLATVTADLAAIQSKYEPLFKADLDKLTALQNKYASVPEFVSAITPIMVDFRDTTARIKANWTNPNSFVDGSNTYGTVADLALYAEEEAGEFATSIFQLETMGKAFKTITCVKGKLTKKVTGSKPACPKGYSKKK